MTMNLMEPPAVERMDTNPFLEVATSGCSGDQQAQPTSSNDAHQDAAAHDSCPESVDGPELLGKIPPEIAMLLVLSGIAGIVLPGPIGTPLLLAGGVTIWPKTFQPIEKWFSRRFPSAHREGVYQIKQFISHIENRFPNNEKQK